MKKTEVELESRVIHGAHGVAAEEDHIKTGKIVATGALALGIFLVGCLWAVWLQVAMQKEANPDGPAPVPAVVGQYEIGIVNQRLFEQDTHAEEKIGAQQSALAKGWGEKPGTVAHPTMEQAMQTVITQEQQARQQPQQSPVAPQPPQPAPSPQPKR
jgi:hypothetical protein